MCGSAGPDDRLRQGARPSCCSRRCPFSGCRRPAWSSAVRRPCRCAGSTARPTSRCASLSLRPAPGVTSNPNSPVSEGGTVTLSLPEPVACAVSAHAPGVEITRAQFVRIRDWLYETAGITLADHKKSLLMCGRRGHQTEAGGEAVSAGVGADADRSGQGRIARTCVAPAAARPGAPGAALRRRGDAGVRQRGSGVHHRTHRGPGHLDWRYAGAGAGAYRAAPGVSGHRDRAAHAGTLHRRLRRAAGQPVPDRGEGGGSWRPGLARSWR